MRTIRQQKMIYIGILVLIVVTLTIAFATFSNTLNIKSQTTVTPSSNNYQIVISGSKSDPNVTTIIPSQKYATNATISKSGSNFTISNINIEFPKLGSVVDYYFYAHNLGNLTAYFKGGKIENIDGTDLNVKCIAREGTTDSLVQETCKNLTVSLIYEFNNQAYQFASNKSATSSYRYSIPIEKGEVLPLRVTVYYLSSTNSTNADGPFDIQIGNMEYSFSTAK